MSAPDPGVLAVGAVEDAPLTIASIISLKSTLDTAIGIEIIKVVA